MIAAEFGSMGKSTVTIPFRVNLLIFLQQDHQVDPGRFISRANDAQSGST